jgi:toxin-antitoxin system PIN domain toxin
MTFLLDVNVLLILHQPRHPDYRLALRWFQSRLLGDRVATCPMTQAAMFRLLTQGIDGLDRFPIVEARDALRNLVQLPNHDFWPDSLPWLEATDALLLRVQGHRQTTDAYLLGLAIQNEGKLATLDRGIRHLAGQEFESHVELIEN